MNHLGYHLDLQAETSSGQWLWGDNSTLSYGGWNDNQPNSPGTGLTVFLQLPNTLFNDYNGKSSSVICEKFL